MKASELIKILGQSPDGDVLVVSGPEKQTFVVSDALQPKHTDGFFLIAEYEPRIGGGSSN